MIWELYRIGVDALIVQDMGITRLNLPPIPCTAVRRWTTVHRRKYVSWRMQAFVR